jgi:hypothetical protein
MGARKYAEFVARLLNSCEYLDPRPASPSKIEIPIDNPLAFKWIDKLGFRDGKILTIKDMAMFDSGGKVVDRNFNYDFREVDSPVPLFRIDNHGEWQSVFEPCHVHVGREDVKVEFSSSEGKNFQYVLHCIKRFYLNEQQDWDEEGEDDTNA